MKTTKIAIVVGDLGSTKELLLAAEAMQKRGLEITWYADLAGHEEMERVKIKQMAEKHFGSLLKAGAADRNAEAVMNRMR